MLRWSKDHADWLCNFDIIHCHLGWSGLFGLAIRRAARRNARRPPVLVHTNHGVGLDARFSQRLLLGTIYRLSDGLALMAVDSYWERFVARTPRLVSRVIPNGVSLPTKPASPAMRSAALQKLGIPEDAFVVGSIGRMVAERRPLEYFGAFAEIDSASAAPAHFVLGGAGPEVASARAAAKRLGISERVHLPGLVEEPLALMAGLDLYLTMVVGRQAGIAAIEAAALGVPVLGIQVTENPPAEEKHWIRSDRAATVVGRMALPLLHDPQVRRAEGMRQRDHVLAHLGVAAMSKAYYRLYKDAAASAAARRARGGAIPSRENIL